MRTVKLQTSMLYRPSITRAADGSRLKLWTISGGREGMYTAFNSRLVGFDWDDTDDPFRRRRLAIKERMGGGESAILFCVLSGLSDFW